MSVPFAGEWVKGNCACRFYDNGPMTSRGKRNKEYLLKEQFNFTIFICYQRRKKRESQDGVRALVIGCVNIG